MNTKIGNILEEVKNFAIIPHVCSNNGTFNSSFAKQLTKLYPEVREAYERCEKYECGEIQPVRVASRLIFVNMICMEGSHSAINIRPLALHHLETCLERVREFARNMDLKVHMPSITCVPKNELDSISKIISKVSSDFTVWVLPKKEVAQSLEPVSINLNQALNHGTTSQPTFRISRKTIESKGHKDSGFNS